MASDYWSILGLEKPADLIAAERFKALLRTLLALAFCADVSLLFVFLVVLARLGADALSAPSGQYIDAARNFLLALASAFGAPFLIWRAIVAHRQAAAATRQAHVALENHITGIFSKSIELMGSMRQSDVRLSDQSTVTRFIPNTEARLGAIYSLERLLRQSERDRNTIVETLCAYVRENSPLDVPEDEAERSIFLRGDAPPSPTNRKDVQAAITVIGRRPPSREEILDLRQCNLVGYDLSDHIFDGADFSGSFLNGANLSCASFQRSVFSGTFLRNANLKRASFKGSLLDDCEMVGARIEETDFSYSTVKNTDLRKARTISIDLSDANLEYAFGHFFDYAIESIERNGINFSNANEVRTMYNLISKAKYNERTTVSESTRKAIEMMAASQNPNAQKGRDAPSSVSNS